MWHTSPLPASLCESSLTPIPKGSPSLDPHNYRGIAVSSVFTKLHEHILFQRADRLSESLGLRSPTQCGFRSQHGTLDALFTLQHLVTRARNRGCRLYVVFLDFVKAFDLVSRDQLLARCARLGYTGSLFDAITTLYDQVQYRVKIRGCLGDPITSTVGIKQGSHLSPLLFGWFIEQLHSLLLMHVAQEDLTTVGNGPNAVRVTDIFYADDGTLISGSPLLVQQMLNLLHLFSGATGMMVSIIKTKWMEFLPFRAKPDTSILFTYDGHALPRVEEFSYMGILWHVRQNLRLSHLPVARSSGLKALYATLHRCKQVGATIPDTYLRLFRSLVQPVLTYGCQVWGVYLLKQGLGPRPTNNMLDRVQMQFLHILSGVHGKAHHLSLLHEFGMLPLVHYMLKLQARFWNKLVDMAPQRMLYQAFLSDLQLMIERKCKTCWSYLFLSAMHQLGLSPSPGSFTGIEACLDLSFAEPDVMAQLALRAQQFLSPGSGQAGVPRCPRLCPSQCVTGFTYRFWIGMKDDTRAPHLCHFIPRGHWQLLVRMRLSCLSLQVELGKRTRTPRAQRFCEVHSIFAHARPNFHHDCVEDIRHFILDCPAYEAIRQCPRYACIFLFPRDVTTSSARLRHVFGYEDQRLLAECLHEMWSVRTLITSKSVQWGTPHPFLPQPWFSFPDWWRHGCLNDSSADPY